MALKSPLSVNLKFVLPFMKPLHTSFLIELPTQARQFRRVNDEFVSSLEAEMERNPAGSYGALFVVTKEITNKDE